jgi:hypothetical protein
MSCFLIHYNLTWFNKPTNSCPLQQGECVSTLAKPLQVEKELRFLIKPVYLWTEMQRTNILPSLFARCQTRYSTTSILILYGRDKITQRVENWKKKSRPSSVPYLTDSNHIPLLLIEFAVTKLTFTQFIGQKSGTRTRRSLPWGS